MTANVVVRSRALAVAIFVAVVAIIIGCNQNLNDGNACPAICPQQPLAVQDTILDDVTIDTSIAGFPPIGHESNLLLSFHQDTFETRAVIRYDSLQNYYVIEGTVTNSPIVTLDSVVLQAVRPEDDSLQTLKAPFTVQVYDLGATLDDDTTSSVLSALFTPNHLLGSQTYDTLTDTMRIPVRTDTVLSRMQNAAPLRIGLKVISDSSIDLRFTGQQVGPGVVMLAYPTQPDSVDVPVTINPRSKTPTNLTYLSGALGTFTILAVPQAAAPAGVVRVGDFPWRRLLFRFKVPSSIIDSTAVIRATLLLTQRPNRNGVSAGDSIVLQPATILVSNVVTSLAARLQFATPPTSIQLGTDTLTPRDSGLRLLEVVNLVRAWSNTPDSVTPRELALEVSTEGNFAGALDFFSLGAPASVRPRLRITYVLKPKVALP